MILRSTIRSFLAAVVIIAAIGNGAHTEIASPNLEGHATAAGLWLIADAGRCTAHPAEEITVATLNNVPIVMLMANGHPVVLVLDTGAERTVVTPQTAERLGAQPPRIEFQRQIGGLVGALPSREVELRSFSIGNTPITWHRIAVAPVTTSVVFSTPLDGILGADVLSDFDLDIDLAHHRLGFFKKGDCTSYPPWDGNYTRLATGRSRDEHLFFRVELDQYPLTAIIDSGAQRSFISEAVAHRMGVSESILAQDKAAMAQAATAGRVSAHVHRFSELKLGGEAIRSPELVVGAANLRDCDLILGVDLIKSRRVWLSYGSRQVFLSR